MWERERLRVKVRVRVQVRVQVAVAVAGSSAESGRCRVGRGGVCDIEWNGVGWGEWVGLSGILRVQGRMGWGAVAGARGGEVLCVLDSVAPASFSWMGCLTVFIASRILRSARAVVSI